MTISREYPGGPFVAQCDTCLDTEELDGETFKEAVDDAKAKGFTFYKEDEEWQHICTGC